MSRILAFDTSNYTTSACVYDTQAGIVWENRIMIPVANGKCGVRQSDAVFHHVKNLESLFNDISCENINCVCASCCPSERENSYMPCFIVGMSYAKTISALYGLPMYSYSHQKNHIMAAAVTSGAREILKKPFLAYHVSGGTTDIMLCSPDKETFCVKKIGGSADISCGQLIDRTGTLLGFPFPCGKHLEKCVHGSLSDNIMFTVNDGFYNLSGFQNKAEKMYTENKCAGDVCNYVLSVVLSFIVNSIEKFRKVYGELPVLMSGGVMSNKLLSDVVRDKFSGVHFAQPEYSLDNAAGVAMLCAAERGELCDRF